MLELFCRPNQGSATALGEGREAGTSPLLFVFFMRGVMFCCHLYFSRFHLFSVDFQESVDRIPDSGRDLQIACDKRIVGTELLFGNCELRECPSQGTDLQSGKSGRLGGWIDRVLYF